MHAERSSLTTLRHQHAPNLSSKPSVA
jgi:hypothetical protein